MGRGEGDTTHVEGTRTRGGRQHRDDGRDRAAAPGRDRQIYGRRLEAVQAGAPGRGEARRRVRPRPHAPGRLAAARAGDDPAGPDRQPSQAGAGGALTVIPARPLTPAVPLPSAGGHRSHGGRSGSMASASRARGSQRCRRLAAMLLCNRRHHVISECRKGIQCSRFAHRDAVSGRATRTTARDFARRVRRFPCRQRIPRARGDGPERMTGESTARRDSPRSRGWTLPGREAGRRCGRAARPRRSRPARQLPRQDP